MARADLYTRRIRTAEPSADDAAVLEALEAAALVGPDSDEAILVGICNANGVMYRSVVLLSPEQADAARAGLRGLGFEQARAAPDGFDRLFVKTRSVRA